MKKILLLFTLTSLFYSCGVMDMMNQKKTTSPVVEESSKSFNHVLLIEFKNNTPIYEFTKEIMKFRKISSVKDVTFGPIKPNTSNKEQQYKYCLILKFKDEKGMVEYLKNPYHETIYLKHKPYIKSIYTADFDSL